MDVLVRVACRSDLSPPVQIYLVDAVVDTGFGGDQGSVLIALIENPVCTEETRKHIAKRLGSITFSLDRKRVADALADVRDYGEVREDRR
jgi:hypothetical protein